MSEVATKCVQCGADNCRLTLGLCDACFEKLWQATGHRAALTRALNFCAELCRDAAVVLNTICASENDIARITRPEQIDYAVAIMQSRLEQAGAERRLGV